MSFLHCFFFLLRPTADHVGSGYHTFSRTHASYIIVNTTRHSERENNNFLVVNAHDKQSNYLRLLSLLSFFFFSFQISSLSGLYLLPVILLLMLALIHVVKFWTTAGGLPAVVLYFHHGDMVFFFVE